MLRRNSGTLIAMVAIALLAPSAPFGQKSPGFFATAASIFPCASRTSADDVDKKEQESVSKEYLPIVRDKELRKKDRQKLAEAIQTLGVFRIEEAIPDLVELLDFAIRDVKAEPKYRRLAREELYPAFRALRKMGGAEIPAVIKAVAEKDRSPEFLENAQYLVLRSAGGRESTKMKLADAIGKEKDKARLERLKAFYARYNFGSDKAEKNPQ